MTEDYNIGLLLKVISDKLRQEGDAVFAQYGLTGPQVGYLNYIRGSGGSISQRELERMAGVSHPTIVGVIGRLQKKGYVEVRTDERDRRNRIIRLTDKAESVTDHLKRGEREMNARMLRGLTDDEMRDLGRMLQVIDDNLCASLGRKESEGDGKTKK